MENANYHTSVGQTCLRCFLAFAIAFALLPLSFAPATPAFAETSTNDSTTEPSSQPSQGTESASSSEQRVVKVGYMDQKGVFSRTEDGKFEGYTYDYLVRIAQFTGWTYEFVEAQGATSNDKATNLLEMLESGEVDIEGSMTYSPALAEMFEYPLNSYGMAHTALFIPESNASVSPTDYIAKGSLNVALLSSAKQRREELEYFCEKSGIHLTTIECTSIDELKSKTSSGEADAFLEIDVNAHEGFTILTSFVARPYFFAAPKGQREIIDEIDKTIQRINESNPTLQSTLYNTYFQKTPSNYPLTDEELAFAKQHKTLRVGIAAEKAPLQTFDKETGELEGVTKGILDYLSEHTGLAFEVVRINPTDDLYRAMRDENIDIIAGIDDNLTVSSLLGVSLSAPYITTSRQLVYNKTVNPENLTNKKLALPWELASGALNMDAEIVEYQSLEECFKAVNDGSADYTYGSSYTLPYYTSLNRFENLLSLPVSGSSMNVCLGIVQPVEPELLSIVNKSLRSLSSTELDALVYDSAFIDKEEEVGRFIQNHLLEFTLICIVILVVFLVLLALYFRTRMAAARTVRDENRRFRKLYSLASEEFFEYTIKDDLFTISSPAEMFPLRDLSDIAQPSEEGAYCVVRNGKEALRRNTEPEVFDTIMNPSETSVEVHHVSGDGTQQWLRILSHYVRGDDGKPISIIGKVTNIDVEMREKLDLSKRARHDGLTGLLNWETFQEAATELLQQGKAGALLIADTDDFKLVNDTYGHLAGDRALQNTAAALAGAFRPQDLIGRLGGDEFAICINGSIDHEKLLECCKSIIEHGITFLDQNNVEHTITLSLGGVELSEKATDYEAAYHQADQVLYRIKSEGKNRFAIENFTEC